jgi:hypothetical protein
MVELARERPHENFADLRRQRNDVLRCVRQLADDLPERDQDGEGERRLDDVRDRRIVHELHRR